MLLKLGPFAGELPRLAAEHLPDEPSFATVCEDAKLYSGDLIPYRALGLPQAGGGTVVFVKNRRYTFAQSDVTAILALQDSTRTLNPDVFTSGEKRPDGTDWGPRYFTGRAKPNLIGFPELAQPGVSLLDQAYKPTWTYDPWVDALQFGGGYGAGPVQQTGETREDAVARYLHAAPLRSYVYTLVNELGWESKPSPPSVKVQRVHDGDRTHVTIPVIPEVPDSTKYRLYRSRAGNVEAGFFRVTDEDLTAAEVVTAPYVDVKGDNQLGLGLTTERWDPPDPRLQGLTLVQNGMLAAFVGKHLHFSQPGLPWAWPIENGYDLDEEIVALATVSGRCVVLTERYPYVVYGSNPASFVPRKIDSPYGCVSKNSVVVLDNAVVYSSYAGLIRIVPSLESEEVTAVSHSWETWRDGVDPRTVAAGWHRGKYLAVHDAGNERAGGFLYDFRQEAAWFESLPLIAGAQRVFTDHLEGKTYVQTDRLREFDLGEGNPVTFRWRSRRWVLPDPAAFTVVAVVADFDPDAPVLRGPDAQRAVNADADRPVPSATRRLGTSQDREPQVAVRVYYDRDRSPVAEASFVDGTPARIRVSASGLHREVSVEVEATVRVKRVYLGQTMADLKGG